MGTLLKDVLFLLVNMSADGERGEEKSTCQHYVVKAAKSFCSAVWPRQTFKKERKKESNERRTPGYFLVA